MNKGFKNVETAIYTYQKNLIYTKIEHVWDWYGRISETFGNNIGVGVVGIGVGVDGVREGSSATPAWSCWKSGLVWENFGNVR